MEFKTFTPAAWSKFLELFPKDTALVVDTLPTATVAGLVRFNRADSKWYISVADGAIFKWTAMESSGIHTYTVSNLAELNALRLTLTEAIFLLDITTAFEIGVQTISTGTYLTVYNSTRGLYESKVNVQGNSYATNTLSFGQTAQPFFRPYDIIELPTFWLDSDFRDIAAFFQSYDETNMYCYGRWAGGDYKSEYGTGSDDGWCFLGTGDDSSNINGIVMSSAGTFGIWINPDIMNQDLENTDWETWCRNAANVKITKLGGSSSLIDTTLPDSAGSIDVTSYFRCNLDNISGSIMNQPTVRLYKNGKIVFSFTLDQNQSTSAKTLNLMAHLYVSNYTSEQQSSFKQALSDFFGEEVVTMFFKKTFTNIRTEQAMPNPSGANIAVSTPSYMKLQAQGSTFSLYGEDSFLAWSLANTTISGFNTYEFVGYLA